MTDSPDAPRTDLSDLFATGLDRRRATLGAEYVDRNFAAADDLTRPFQEAMTAWCWGFGWGDDTLDAKTRSLMNLAMIGALGKMTEWETHLRGARAGGVTWDEVRAAIHVIGIYCGVPQALECFRVAKATRDAE
ncbi:MAG: carboxymuconolactone decarboxylase family protein [Paracoccaceae bacterium]